MIIVIINNYNKIITRLIAWLNCTSYFISVASSRRKMKLAEWRLIIESKVVHTLLKSVGLGADLSLLAVSPHAGDLVINPVVGCHHFLTGLQLPSQLEHHCRLASTNLYCLVTETYKCK